MLLDVAGNGFKVPPAQIAVTWVKVGKVPLFTFIVIVAVVAH